MRLKMYQSKFRRFLDNDPLNQTSKFMPYFENMSVFPFRKQDILDSGIIDFLQDLAKTENVEADVRFVARQIGDRWAAGNFSTGLVNIPSPTPPPVSDDEVEDEPEAAEPEQQQQQEEEEEVTMGEANVDVYNHMMRGVIRLVGSNGRRSSKLEDGAQRSAAVIGHNGVQVGTWWPMQICARRDGAHGAPVAGIYGQYAHGTFSIISSGGQGYEESDSDNGNVLLYSGSHGSAKSRLEGVPELTQHTRYLMRSMELMNPVRVIRGKGASKWAPVVGLRYDGLYKVVSWEIASRNDGSEFYQFRLEREPEQEDLESLVRRSPTTEERVAWVTLRNRA
jgi:hypothetical protein